MAEIIKLMARQILDSKGNPALEVDAFSKNNMARASVPSGASTGKHEAVELRDGGKAFSGKGVEKAIASVKKISRLVMGMDAANQEAIDRAMIKLDATASKSVLGANATLAVSIACCRLAALENRVPLYEHIGSLFGNRCFLLPTPFFNVINGGKHAGSNLEIQEYMLIPTGAKSFGKAMQIGAEVYHKLKQVIQEKYGRGSVNVGDEGGFTPQCSCAEEPFELVEEAVLRCGYGKKVQLGIDAAASSFYRNRKYYLEGQELSQKELMERYAEMAKNFPLVSIEDPFHEEDFDSFAALTRQIGKRVQVVGDDLTVTNISRIQRAAVGNCCNCLLLKPNQIGTVSEALEAARLAIDSGWKVMVSHRSGETEDSFIADLAVGLGTGQLKAGAPCRGERTAKYNQLLRIEEELGKKAKYNGKIK